MTDPITVPPTWYTVDDARAEWRDAPADDGVLLQLLTVAQLQVTEYAPDWHDDAGNVVPIPADQVPVNYRHAQIMQVRNIFNAATTDPSTTEDGDVFVIRPYPMDNFIKNIIRPRRGVPVVG